MSTDLYRLGIDIGSTTAKIIFLNPPGEAVFSAYRRHNAETLATLHAILHEAMEKLGNANIEFLVTGSAGMGVAEKYDCPSSRKWLLRRR